MQIEQPYNAGEIRKVADGHKVMIMGHIWWPVEKVNAYHCIKMDDKGEFVSDIPEYIWDHSHGNWDIV